ncbi:MAG: hypothetical protein PHY29_09640 [Syntrophales bacterium]|jgi:hypothetical protein|nr:hypothetical protein [Syntrophales bacterium]
MSDLLAGLKIVQKIACVERVKKISLRDTHRSPEDKEFTPTMKMNRKLAHHWLLRCFLVKRLRTMLKTTIAILDGHVGGGEIALSCNYCISIRIRGEKGEDCSMLQACP